MRIGKRVAGCARHQCGFTYVALMIVVAILGLVAATSLQMGAVVQRSSAEQTLLDIGGEFSDALKSYAEATPAGQPNLPASLQDLLSDPRSVLIRRHLRKIYTDPITGSAEWGLIYLNEKNGITGVYSRSDGRPIKQAGFEARFAALEAGDVRSYRDWVFTAGQAAVMPVPAPDPNSILPPARILTNPRDLIGVTQIAPGSSTEPVVPTPPDVGGRKLISPRALQ